MEKYVRSGPDHILAVHINQGWNIIIKGSKDATSAGTLSLDKACSTIEKQPHQFSYKEKNSSIYLSFQYCSTDMRPGRDCGSGETKPSL